jgi:hypothetical protein
MASPLDPRSWFADPRRSAGADRTWLDAWFDLTTWWVDPALSATQPLGMRPDQLLAQLIDGIARRFEGQRVDVDVRGRRVRAVLDGIRLTRRDARSELSVDLAAVDVDGVRAARLELRARSVRVGPGATTTFVADDIDVDGELELRDAVAMVDERVPDWSLDVDADDEVVASQPRRRLAVHVEPTAHAGELRLEVRSIELRGFHVSVPRWLRLERSFAVPLEPGWTLTEAAAEGARVRFRLHGEGVREDLDLRQLRDAIGGTGPLRV